MWNDFCLSKTSSVVAPLNEVMNVIHPVSTKLINLLKPTGYEIHQQIQHSRIALSAHIVFMCFVFISEQTATCATYNTNRLVFITEMRSVYYAVRTGSLNRAVYSSSLNC